MKINKYLFALILITIGLIAACKKEGTSKVKTENPMKTTIAQKLVVDSVITQSSGKFEFGYKFYASKNGTITKLGCRMPETGNYRVSLWDFATKDLISATTVAVSDTSKFTYNDISPVSITANTRYVVSINNTNGGVGKEYYIYFKKSGASFVPNIYPFTTGSITYEDFREIASSISTFPSNLFSTYAIVGPADFQFEYEE